MAPPSTRFLTAFHVVNAAVILSYPLVISEWAKTRYPTKASSLTSWERQSAAGLLAMLVARFFRRQNLDQWVADGVFHAKVSLAVLTYLIDPVLCAWYLAIVFVMFLHLPVPKYEGPSEVIALTPAAFRKRVLEDSVVDGSTWLVHFRAGYSAKSRALEPTFADLSVRYATPLQKFASVDVGRWPREAAARGVDVDAFGNNSQVPSIVMYHAGKETLRAPQLYEDGSRVLGGGRMREVDLLTGFEIESRYRRTRGKDATSKKAE